MAMRLNTWGYLWSEALRGLWRNGFMAVASVSTVAICLTVLATVLLAAVNLQYIASFIEGQVEVVAYVREDFDRNWKNRLVAKVEQLPGVTAATFVSKEEALVRLKEQFGDHQSYLEGLDGDNNPLRDMVEVRLVSLSEASTVAAELQLLTDVEEVSHRQDVVDRLLAVTNLIRVGGLVVVGLLGIATIFIVANTIRLTVYARRREIAIMKLVGATDGFIRWPFFLEGLLLGLLGAVVAAAVAWVGYGTLESTLTGIVPFLPLLQQQPLVSNLAQLLLALGAVIGAIGSSVSVRRFLRV